MKKYGFLVSLVIMFSFLVNVNAISMITFKVSTDKTTLKKGETFDLKIYAESEGDLSPDTTSFHIEYDLEAFEFVSYDSKVNTSFDELGNYTYLEEGAALTHVDANELIGTLKLKVKDNVEVDTSTILYRTTYEGILNKGSIKINIDNKETTVPNKNNDKDSDDVTTPTDEDENTDDVTTPTNEDKNTNSTDKESDNSNETNKVLIYLSIFLSIITISSAITAFYIIRKNKKNTMNI